MTSFVMGTRRVYGFVHENPHRRAAAQRLHQRSFVIAQNERMVEQIRN